MNEILSRLRAWWEHPYSAEGSVSDWFLFVGIVIIAAFLWSRVIERIG